MKKCILICLLLLPGCFANAQATDTFEVYFRFNDPQLSKRATDFIDRMIFKDVLIHGQKLTVLGYADYVGGYGYNDTLSATRARNVKNYLISSGFADRDIKLCIGKGKIDHSPVAGKDGIAADRKVQIIIDNAWHIGAGPDIPGKPGYKLTDMPAGSSSGSSTDKLKKDSLSNSLSLLKVNSTYQLNILFENVSSLILSKSYPVLKQLLDFMVKNPTVKIQIEGHVCCMDPLQMGDGIDKDKPGPLSVNRAKAIYDYLVKNGISSDRLRYVGLGGRVPAVSPERTPEDEEKNRRVEARIISK